MSKAASRRQPTLDDFVVLLVEDDEKVRSDAKESLERIEDVYVVEAADVDGAKVLIDRHYIDAAVVDMELQEVRTAGLEVTRRLRKRASSAPVVVWTKYFGKGKTIAKFVGSKQIVRIVDKGRQPFSEVELPIEAAVQAWRERRVSIANRTLVRDLLWKRRKRHPYELRKARRELDRELERIYRRLFGGVRGLEEDTDADVNVTFRPIKREGLSSAVTVEGKVTIGRDDAEEPVRGNRCVVKVGPVAEIRQEVERYEGFVQFGVRMAQRVELLSYAYDNLLGGIAYSFAGGVFGHSLVSFDQLLQRSDGVHLAAEAMEQLFDPEGKNWYGVRCRPVSPPEYMKETYKTDFDDCFDELYRSLDGLQRKFSRKGISVINPSGDDPGTFSFEGGQLTIPPRNISGSNAVYPQRLACLVHGDMHGGNVMVELGSSEDGKPIDTDEDGGLKKAELKRICLIDYRSAGPGPRAVDAVALQASIRLADAAAIAAEVAPGVRERDLKGEALQKAISRAANRVQAEAKWLEKAWSAEPDGEPVAGSRSAPWAAASALLAARMRFTFKDMQRDEYLSIAIPCAIRQFGYDVGPLARVRLLAWLSALYSAAIANEDG